MNEKEGNLFYNRELERYDIRFSNRPYTTYGGLHCGETLQIFINGEWIGTRIECKGDKWYLIGIKTDIEELDESRVKI